MARIGLPNTTTADLPSKLQDVERSGALINVFRSMLRSPEIATAVVALGAAQFAASALTSIDREIAILAAGACFESPYEASHHEAISRSVGVTDAQRAAIADKQWNSPDLSDAQQSMTAFVAAVAAGPHVSDAAFDAIRTHCTDKQIVELIVQTGYYFLIARITTVLDVPLDPAADDRVLRAGIELAAGSLS